MGSLGLHALDGYTAMQAAAGGEQGAGRYVEMFVKGSLDAASALVRQASVQAGGMVAVARNPVRAGYVSTHAALGAIRQCIELGRAMLAARPTGGMAVCLAAAHFLGGQIVISGEVSDYQLRSTGGFDVGCVRIADFTLDFWNEYMTLEQGDRRLATFPDLVMTLDEADGLPVTTAQVRVGQRLAVLSVPWEHLLLGAGMFYPELYEQAERVIGKRLWDTKSSPTLSSTGRRREHGA
jgi:hypothetical protein